VAVPVRFEILDSYVGQYQFEELENRIYTITRDGDRLLFNAPGGPRMELFAESETTFTIVQDEYTFHSKRIR
jgi:hypothetical protein